MEWYMAVIKNYAGFEGRARRKEYWMYVLINALIGMGITAVGLATGLFFLSGLYGLAVMIPGWAVTVRRLHDTNRSGWWMLVTLVPLIGGIILLVFLASAGDYGENDYGSDPKAA